MANVVNGVNVEKMVATINLLKEKPELARFTFRAKNKWVNGAHSQTEIDGFYGAGQEQKREKPHVLVGDEPAALLGEDHGANAVEAVLHALASCLAVGFIYNAAAQGIKVEELTFNLEGNIDLQGFLGLSKEVRPGFGDIKLSYKVKSNAPREKLEELCQYVQDTSPVLDIVKNSVPVSVSLES